MKMLMLVNVGLAILITLGVLYILMQLTKTRTLVNVENFTEPTYASRLNVMKIFEAILSRKPTGDEIEKFSGMENEQDVLTEIVKTYQDVITKQNTEPTTMVAPPTTMVTPPTTMVTPPPTMIMTPTPTPTDSPKIIEAPSIAQVLISIALCQSELDKIKTIIAL